MNFRQQLQKQKLGFTSEELKNKKVLEKVVQDVKPKAAGIKKVSEAEKARQKEYKPLAMAFRKEHPACQLKVPGICTGKTQGIHHKRGKVGKLLIAVEHFLASCNPCNTWVEANHEEAVHMGLIEKRNTETQRYQNTYQKKQK
jgi:hypothetical protein